VAEQIKIAEGFVSLGGAYEEPENENQAKISKIARQFMTKLHIQVNQTMQFYRGQQGGTMPQKLFLAGGASIMPYAAQFFAEKLSSDKVSIQPEYFNPFRNVQIDPAVNLEELSHVAHSFGEVVGVALRNLANCPVEMNLMPDTTLRWRTFNEKKPYFMATVFSLVLVAFSIGFLFQKLAAAKEGEIAGLEPKVQEAQVKAQQMKRANDALLVASNEVSQITSWMDDQYYWVNTLAETRQVLLRSEEEVRKKLAERKPDIQAGIWIDVITTGANAIPNAIPSAFPAAGNAGGAAAAPAPAPVDRAAAEAERMRRVLEQRARDIAAQAKKDAAEAAAEQAKFDAEAAAAAGQPAPTPTPTPASTRAPAQAPAPAPTPTTTTAVTTSVTTVATTNVAPESLTTFTLVLRSINLSAFTGDPAANNQIAYTVESEFKKETTLFDPKTTGLTGNLTVDPADDATFTFGLTVTLAKPLKL